MDLFDFISGFCVGVFTFGALLGWVFQYLTAPMDHIDDTCNRDSRWLGIDRWISRSLCAVQNLLGMK